MAITYCHACDNYVDTTGDWHCPPDSYCPIFGCEDDLCPTCKGRGRVNPLTAPEDFFCAGPTDCPHCDGTGRI